MRKITYNPIWSVVFILLGCLNLYLGLQSGRGMNMILGGVFVLLGILYLINPVLTYSDEKIELKNLFGITIRSYEFDEEEVTIKYKRIHYKGKKIPISLLMVNRKEMRELLEFVSSRTQTSKVVSEFSDEELLDA